MPSNTFISIKKMVLLLIVPFIISCHTESMNLAEEAEQHSTITSTLFKQQKYWNEGNIDKFMFAYWQNEGLSFVGRSGVTKGWKQTLANYKKSYPDKETMGILSFEIIEICPEPEFP